MDNNQGGQQATADERRIEIMEGALASISEDMKAEMKWLNESAGQDISSIFRVPNHEACRPRMVSIGPYHHGEKQLKRLQEYKGRYLQTMLDRTQPAGVNLLEELIATVAPKVKMIRQCYLESTNNFTESDLVKMMVLDGCFIIEFFRQIKGDIQSDDILPNDSYTLVSLRQDLVRLENQVPYFVLEDLFETTNVGKQETSFTTLALKFFDGIMERPECFLDRDSRPKKEHLLDLLRQRLLPAKEQNYSPPEDSSSFELLGSASKLNQAGIAFVQSKASTFLEIKFDSKSGILHIPKLTISDTLQCIFHNIVAFERCFVSCDKHFTAYAMFMGLLIDTADDVRLLCDRRVMSINGVSKEGVASFFCHVSKDTSWDVARSYLESEIAGVNKYVRNQQIRVFFTQLVYTPCRYTWSTIAAIVMLTGAIQTVYICCNTINAYSGKGLEAASSIFFITSIDSVFSESFELIFSL